MRRPLTILFLMLCCARTALAEIPSLQPDQRLQRAVSALFGSTAGTAIVYDMRTRRVLAVTDANLAFRSLHPPGSLMKLATALALYPDHAAVHCTNHVTIAGRDFTCAVEGGHGSVDLRAAIEKSCSIFFYVSGQRLSAAQIMAAARRLGLGTPSPFPAGLAARLTPPRTQRDKTLMLVGEGAAIRITPWDALTMAVRLHDAKDDAGRFVQAAMRDVVRNGTGRGARVAGIDVHGKTGTATWLEPTRPGEPPRTHGWFVCTAGHLALVVFLQQGTGHDAAALCGRILALCAGQL